MPDQRVTQADIPAVFDTVQTRGIPVWLLFPGSFYPISPPSTTITWAVR